MVYLNTLAFDIDIIEHNSKKLYAMSIEVFDKRISIMNYGRISSTGRLLEGIK